LFTETFRENGPPPYENHRFAIRTADWKYMFDDLHLEEGEGLFDLRQGGHDEGDNLLLHSELSTEAQDAFDLLTEEVGRILRTQIYGP
jgi:hypothetical protein